MPSMRQNDGTRCEICKENIGNLEVCGLSARASPYIDSVGDGVHNVPKSKENEYEKEKQYYNAVVRGYDSFCFLDRL